MIISEATNKFLQWAKTEDIGCMFARAMFARPEKYSIRINEIIEQGVEEVKTSVVAATRQSIDNADEAILHVFTSMLSPPQLVELMRQLGQEEGWRLAEDQRIVNEVEHVLFSLRICVGEDRGNVAMSEVVAFAPYEFLPHTRRAPVIAWAIRTKSKFSLDPDNGIGERRANLAAIPIKLPSQAFDLMWEKSKALRARLSGADNPSARARVTLAIPSEFTQHLRSGVGEHTPPVTQY